MQTAAIIVWIYGALVLTGGVMGFAKAKSKPSLIAGAIFGILFIASGIGMWQGKRAALQVTMIGAVMLMAVMGVRWWRTGKFMPAGMLVVLSILSVTLILLSSGGAL